jgi:hypothetical protein
MKSIVVLLALAFLQSTSSVKQEHPKKETTPTQGSPKSTPEPTSPITIPVSQSSPKPEASETRDKSSGWPPWGDIFWPSWALVIVTIVAVKAALTTLRSINAQVDEMRKTGEQTDKLISENITQSKSMQQSVAEAARLASAMEVVAKEIAVSSQAATASVSAIGLQMRAYICVVIGSAVYQDRAKNLKFQALPSIINAGLTPAHKVSFSASAAILPIPLPADFTFALPAPTSGTQVIGPRQNITVSPVVEEFCDDSEIEGIKHAAQGKALYTWGIFTYEDIFGNPQSTRFCQIYTWLADGKTTWGYYAERHNDAT